MFYFLILALATWRISFFFVEEDGPRQVAARIRYAAGIRHNEMSQAYADTVLGEMLLCLWCTSFWVGIGLTMIYLFTPEWIGLLIVLPFALSTGAIVVQKFIEMDIVKIGQAFTRWLDQGAENG